MEFFIEFANEFLEDSVVNRFGRCLDVLYEKRQILDNLEEEGEICGLCHDNLVKTPPENIISGSPQCSHFFHGDCLAEYQRNLITGNHDYRYVYERLVCPICRRTSINTTGIHLTGFSGY